MLKLPMFITRWVGRFCFIMLTAAFFMLFSKQANALVIDYGVRVYAQYYASEIQSSCHSGILLLGCYVTYSEAPNDEVFKDFSAGQPLPYPGIGYESRIEVTAEAREYPVHTTSTGIANFSVLHYHKLITALAYQDGGRTIRDEIPTGDGGALIVMASAESYASILIRLSETLLFTIPDSYDGKNVSAMISIPVDVIRTGAAFASFVVDAGTPYGEYAYRTLTVGSPYQYDFDISFFNSSIDLPILIRPDYSSEHVIEVPFSLLAIFDSGGLGFGIGYVDAMNTIGLNVTSESGVRIRSASGDLDDLLTQSDIHFIQEPDSIAIFGLGAAAFIPGVLRRLRARRGVGA